MSNFRDDLKKLSILFVEDEENLRKAMTNAIGEEFKFFITSKDGEEGIKKFKKYNPDVIVTDISMPIKDGLEFAREVKAMSKEIPIIVLSAFSDKDKLIGAIDVGIDKYLIKPIDPEDILNTIHSITKDRFSVDNIIELGNGYKFDKYKKVLVRNEENINLTKKEILFVSHLIKHLGSFVLHEDIKRIVWSNSKANDTAVRTLVRRVRKKTDPDFIKNVPGLGYKIDS